MSLNLKKLLLVFGSSLFLSVLFINCHGGGSSSATAVDNGGNNPTGTPPTPIPPAKPFEQFRVIGDTMVSGIFDPAIEYDDTGTGYMTYSWVRVPDEVVTHLAKSTDHGATWNYLQALNTKVPGVINGVSVVYRYETSTIFYDPTDVPSRRWKMYVEQLPSDISKCGVATCPGKFDYSTIIARYAATPEGTWSAPVCLFGPAAWGCQTDINKLNSSLSIYLGYNEIGSLVKNGIIYISLDAYTTADGLGDFAHRKIILISSADHGSTWSYVGDLTTAADADTSGYWTFTASSLVHKGSKDYLLMSPAGSKTGGVQAQDGTWIVEFIDISKAQLNRDAQGNLIFTKKVSITKNTGGESDYDEQNYNGGIVFPQIDNSLVPSGEFFQMYNSNQSF